MPFFPLMRTIREDERVSSKVDEYTKKYSRTRDVWEGLTWMLARSPEQGEAIDSVFLMKSKDVQSPTVPVITALYTFDSDEVEVLDVRINKTEED